ncbi:CPBP family intramembrane glutamic endopeptidase [Acetivibrio clariflavus]|uniref:Putative metal-dependent membrane protease n=1 Tax=Acetivibrio clariflavus (strain DSM 19732 / NBRC 101661 / EBR45) TaxID=720554 RepID=G8M369_ACECE|nr:type II CAAX endopeptidase family protein [Acetivibrio clariflavus]AEV70389.1 putative metal-dependent membrane protease [Acetivibrio clariflavus DSM 19732]
MHISYLDMGDRGKNSAVRYICSILTILIFWQGIGSLLYFIPIIYVVVDNNPDTYVDLTTGRLVGIDPLIDYIFLNLTLVCFFIGVYVAMRCIHQRSIKTLITPEDKINWKKFFIGFGVYGILVILSSVADYLAAPETYRISFDAAKFFVGLPVILILTPIQTTAEELFFRGYILQGFGRKIKNTVILSVISGFIFMVPHLLNPEVFKSRSMGGFETISGVAYYFLVGFIFSVVTIKTNSLEVAMGAHMVNNLIGALLVGFSDSVFQTNTVFYTTRFEPVFNLVAMIITSIVFYFVIACLIKTPTLEDV